jgi:glycosyltransferase involved in cell wall biosynthesis
MKDQLNALKISIITPNYNYARYIGETIDSVVSQDHANIEFIIVDDGSTDNSVEVIKQYQDRYPGRITLVTKPNEGHVKTVNHGFKLATGDIVGWMNSDDTFCPNVLGEVMRIFHEHPETDIVYGNWNLMDPEGRFVYYYRHLPFSYLTGVFLGFDNLTSNATFWRRELFDRFGMLNEDFHFNPDGDFFSRISLGTTLRQLKKPLANHRAHPVSMTLNKNTDVMKQKEREMTAVFRNSFNASGISRWLPERFAPLAAAFFKIQRVIRKLLLGHYLPLRTYRAFRQSR